MTTRILCGDSREMLATLPDGSVQTCVTSPPYFGLRDYGHAGQIGLEATVDEYVTALVDVFREVRRVLKDDGTLWLNLGDSYVAPRGNTSAKPGFDNKAAGNGADLHFQGTRPHDGLKTKDLIGIPWRVAFALQADGWYLRQDIIWAKPNPMPESVRDRCTKSHEYLFLLSKQARYYYDAAAIREPNEPHGASDDGMIRHHTERPNNGATGTKGGYRMGSVENGRNKRSVWTVSTQPFSEAHFATFPPNLIEPCILAGTSEKGECPACGKAWVRVVERETAFTSGSGKAGNVPNGKYKGTEQADSGTYDIRMGPSVSTRTVGWEPSCNCDAGDPAPQTVLDPFGGAGTTGLVADRLGRDSILIELNPDYAEMARRRITNDAPMFASVEIA